MSIVEELLNHIYNIEGMVRALKDEVKKIQRESDKINRMLSLKGYWIDWRYVYGCGPYACLRWIEGGKVRAKYLGKRVDLERLKLPESERVRLEEMLERVRLRAEKLKGIVKKAERVLSKTLDDYLEDGE